MNPVIMHVNYGEKMARSFGTKTVDDICRMAAEIGFNGVEFRGDPPQELKDLSFKEYYTQIAEGKKKYGLPDMLLGVSVKDAMNPDKDARAKAVELALEKAKMASELFGTTVCNTMSDPVRSPIPTAPAGAYEFAGSAAATKEQWDLLVDTYQQIGKGLEPIGVKFAFETHMNYIHDVPSACKKLVDLIDSPMIGINMDYGNTVYFPVQPSVTETIDLYGDKLFYTHLKNSVVAGTRKGCALCDGEINHREYLAKLREVGFSGPIGIEAPRPGDRTWFAQQDLAYYKAVVASL